MYTAISGGSGSHGMAYPSVSERGKPLFFVFWRSEGRSAMPQGHKNEGSETKPTKRKNETNPTKEKQNRVTYRGQDRQNGREHLHTQPARQLR